MFRQSANFMLKLSEIVYNHALQLSLQRKVRKRNNEVFCQKGCSCRSCCRTLVARLFLHLVSFRGFCRKRSTVLEVLRFWLHQLEPDVAFDQLFVPMCVMCGLQSGCNELNCLKYRLLHDLVLSACQRAHTYHEKLTSFLCIGNITNRFCNERNNCGCMQWFLHGSRNFVKVLCKNFSCFYQGYLISLYIIFNVFCAASVGR